VRGSLLPQVHIARHVRRALQRPCARACSGIARHPHAPHRRRAARVDVVFVYGLPHFCSQLLGEGRRQVTVRPENRCGLKFRTQRLSVTIFCCLSTHLADAGARGICMRLFTHLCKIHRKRRRCKQQRSSRRSCLEDIAPGRPRGSRRGGVQQEGTARDTRRPCAQPDCWTGPRCRWRGQVKRRTARNLRE
jgi:hypothetical protein